MEEFYAKKEESIQSQMTELNASNGSLQRQCDEMGNEISKIKESENILRQSVEDITHSKVQIILSIYTKYRRQMSLSLSSL